jgi:biopolymer transport protein ExbD
MPVRSAGSRLYHSVKFKHLVKKAGTAAGGHSSNIALNLTPFVDMMTILVTFLLMVFGSSSLLQAQKGLELPIAESHSALQDAPIIIVTHEEINYEGQLVATVESVMRDDSPTFKIDALYERLEASAKKIHEYIGRGESAGKYSRDMLKACDEAKAGRAVADKICPDGLAILQADQATDVRLINKIVNTAKAAGFDNLLFAVKNK